MARPNRMKRLGRTTHGQSVEPFLIFPVDRVNIPKWNGHLGGLAAIDYDDNNPRLRKLFTFLKANS